MVNYLDTRHVSTALEIGSKGNVLRSKEEPYGYESENTMYDKSSSSGRTQA